MLRSLAGKVVWVGRTAAMVLGLALVLALVFGVATTAIGATGGKFILGKANSASTVSKLTASIAGPALTLVNNSTNAAATALNMREHPQEPLRDVFLPAHLPPRGPPVYSIADSYKMLHVGGIASSDLRA